MSTPLPPYSEPIVMETGSTRVSNKRQCHLENSVSIRIKDSVRLRLWDFEKTKTYIRYKSQFAITSETSETWSRQRVY